MERWGPAAFEGEGEAQGDDAMLDFQAFAQTASSKNIRLSLDYSSVFSGNTRIPSTSPQLCLSRSPCLRQCMHA